MNYNGYVSRNSIIHRMNPSLKFLLTFIIIIMIFIPYGFIFQIVLLVICLSLFFLAKLPLKKFFSIIKSILVMMAILLLINWVTYKTPGVSFNFDTRINNIFEPNFLDDTSYHLTRFYVNGKQHIFLQGEIFGGGFLDFDPKLYGLANAPHNGFIDLGPLVDNGTKIVSNGKTLTISTYLSNLTSQLSNDFNNVKNTYQVIDNHLIAFFYRNEIYSISTYAIMYMLYVSLKIFLMILIVTILTSTTSSLELTSALEDILNPFRIFKLPVNEWSMVIALGLRFIPSLLDESGRILKAQASRGLDFSNGNIKERLLAISSLISPLFTIAFKKSGELSNAMEARGYNPRYLRTRYREYRIYFCDWIFFGFVCLLLGLLISFVSIGGKVTYISPLGIYEALIMFS